MFYYLFFVMWSLFDHINNLLENRGDSSSVVKDSGVVQNFTKKKLLSVCELSELFESSSRIRNSLNFIKSFWEISLFNEIKDFFKSLCVDDLEYQDILKNVSVSGDAFDSYISNFNTLFSAVRLLEDKRCLNEINEILKFLKTIDKSNYRPLSDEALKRKLSN